MKKNKRHTWHNSIKFKLFTMMITISVIPMMILGIYNINLIQREVEASIHREHALAAERISHAVTDLVETLQTSLETVALSNAEILETKDQRSRENFLYRILNNFPHIEEVSMISPKGMELEKVSKRFTVAHQDLGTIRENKAFDNLKEGRYYIGKPEIGMDNQMIFTLGVPVGGNFGDFKGALIAKVSLRQVIQEISAIELAKDSYIMLIDEGGALIGHTDYSQVLRGQEVRESPGVMELSKNPSGEENPSINREFQAMDYQSYTGEEVLGVYGSISKVDWGVVVEQPLSTAYAPLRNMLWRLSFALVFIMTLITILGALFILYFIKPVNKLAEGVAMVKEGNLDYRITGGSHDELGVVIEAFNEMITEIKKKRNNENLVIQGEKKAAIGSLAAGVAHEINNPMNNLYFYTTDLLERLEQEDINRLYEDGDINEYLEIIQEQIKRCTDITGNLLNFSRETTLEMERVDLERVVGETLSLTEHQLKKKNIEVTFLCEEREVGILGNQSQVQQVLLNIITNAIDAMESGGVLDIKIEKESSDESFYRLTFRDRGEGIADEVKGRIFDPFYTTKPIGKGTGLGLPISQAIVERMRGSIRINSRRGEGTQVVITLPRIAEEMKDESY